MTVLDQILDHYPDSTFLKADGFDHCIVGVDSKSEVLIYDVSKVIETLEREMNEEEAWEHFYFNIEGAYMGEKTPIWMYTYE